MSVVDPVLLLTSLSFIFPALAAYHRKKWPGLIVAAGVGICSFIYHIAHNPLAYSLDVAFVLSYHFVGLTYAYFLGPNAFMLIGIQLVLGYYIYSLPGTTEETRDSRDITIHAFYHLLSALEGYLIMVEAIRG
uniref:Uncharacterized protein n=1 Tax=viral metagenome TaxID=1070528 RepID=A0A6C0JHK2_9ZZZZ